MTESPSTVLKRQFGLVMTPILRRAGSDALDFEGTAVLVATNSRWLFTAAHVIGAHEIVFLSGQSQIVIPRDRFGISPPELDLAYAELTPAEAASLEAVGLRFLPCAALDGSISELSPRRNGCLIAGFPATEVRVDGDERKIAARLTAVTSQFLTPKERLGLKFDARLQVAAKFGGLSEGRQKFRPEGMSGSGIWREEAGQLQLVGIATDFDPARRIILGTRLRPLLEELLRHLREDFPASG